MGAADRSDFEKRGLRAQDYLLLAIGAAYWPLNIMASNLIGIVHPERLVALVILIWLVNILLAVLLSTFGLPRFAATATCFLLTVLFMSGGALTHYFGSATGYLILITVTSLAGWLVIRLHQDILLQAVTWGLAVALAAQPAVNLFHSWNDLNDSSVVRPEAMSLTLSLTPDIFLVVLDGYPGHLAMEQDEVPEGSVHVRPDLESLGFQVPESVWSPYWKTHLAIPAILDMGYPVTSDPSGDATTAELHGIISGAGRLFQVLESNGYSTHVVESGWTGSSCGKGIDHCAPSPVMDEAMYLTLRYTVLASVFGNFGGPFANGAVATMNWFVEHGPSISASSEPNFVFAHLFAPHPPFVLTGDCSIFGSKADFEPWFTSGEHTLQVREERLVDQMDCVDRFMVDFAESIEPDDVVVFVADHGTDRRNQSSDQTLDWSHESIVERLNVFAAARLPGDCPLDAEMITSNLMLQVLTCLSNAQVALNRERIWINPMVELKSDVVEHLMSMRPVG